MTDARTDDIVERIPRAINPRSLANLRPPWQKGISANPAGTVSAYHKARAICSKATEEAAKIQVELMRDPDSRVAFMATEAVLRRGAGVPRDHSAEDQAAGRVNLASLSLEDQATLARLLQRALGIGADGGS